MNATKCYSLLADRHALTWSDGRCPYCDEHPPTYPPWQHSDWVHDDNGNRDFNQPFDFDWPKQQQWDAPNGLDTWDF